MPRIDSKTGTGSREAGRRTVVAASWAVFVVFALSGFTFASWIMVPLAISLFVTRVAAPLPDGVGARDVTDAVVTEEHEAGSAVGHSHSQ